MTGLVVDASVVVKWLPLFQHKLLASEAQNLLARWQLGSLDLLAPDLVWTEVAKVHWRAARQNRCTPDDARTSVASLHGHGIPIVPTEPLIDQALRILLSHGRTAYDSLYVALAVNLDLEFITADEKLANALAGRFPVKWLGAV
jgi:predicted nucleic acid-binding protein